MSDVAKKFWKTRLEKCKKALEQNNFEVFLADTVVDARRIVMTTILPALNPKTVSWGDSLTLHSTSVLEEIQQDSHIQVIVTFAKDAPRKEILERRRQALLVDLFLTGTNALTERGQLVNLDMIGNCVGAITFGTVNVIILVGRNKIVPDIESAMYRIRNYAAPLNAIRHPDFKPSCRKTSCCMDCKSPDRICNTWTITEKSYPKGRIKVFLINTDLGL